MIALVPAAAGALRWTALPFGYYTSDTGPALGAYAAAYFRPRDALLTTRDSCIQPMVVYTWKRQFRVDLNGDFYSAAATWRLVAESRYEKYPSTFWPPPFAENVPKEFYADYVPETVRADARAYRRLVGKWYAGAGAFLQDWHLKEWAGIEGYIPGPRYAPGAEGGLVVAPTAVVEYDSRDKRNAATEGAFARARFSISDDSLGADYSFRWYEADIRFYNPFRPFGAKRWTLACRLFLSGREPAPPFWMMPALGGSALLRGEPEGRARERWLVAYQEELRVPLFWRLCGAVFADFGDVGFTPAEFSFEKAKLTAGAGLRLDLIEGGESRVRLDVGKGKDSLGVYLVFGEAF